MWKNSKTDLLATLHLPNLTVFFLSVVVHWQILRLITHTAQRVGTEGVMNILGQMYIKVVIKLLTNKLPDKNRRVAVDPLTIFQRVCIAKQPESFFSMV